MEARLELRITSAPRESGWGNDDRPCRRKGTEYKASRTTYSPNDRTPVVFKWRPKEAKERRFSRYCAYGDKAKDRRLRLRPFNSCLPQEVMFMHLVVKVVSILGTIIVKLR